MTEGSAQVDPQLIDRACGDGDVDAIGVLSLLLLRSVESRGERQKAGQSHLVGRAEAIPNSNVNNLAYRMLRRCQLEQIPPPPDLVRLIQRQLVAHRPGRGGQRIVERTAVARYLVEHPSATLGEIVKGLQACGLEVTRKTAWEWKNHDPDFQELLAEVKEETRSNS